MTRPARLLAILLLIAPSALAVAGGAGGVGFAGQLYDVSLSSADLGWSMNTGFGYGAGGDGNRVGGFGMSFYGRDMTGGAGGMIVGHEWHAGPITAALTLWGGLGGAAWGGLGYLVGYGSAQAELGVWVLPWMELIGYVGYEAVGSLLPGSPFSRALLRTPVLGFRIAWGSP